MKKINFKMLCLALAVLMALPMAMPVSAREGKTIDTIEIGGEIYTVTSWSSEERDEEIAGILAHETLDRKPTKIEIAKLGKALSHIDYEKAVIISGDDFTITHIPLLYGCAINFISTWSPDSRGLVTKEAKCEITQYNAVVAWANLVAVFNQQPTSVTIEYSGTSSWVAAGIPISWSISSIRVSGSSYSGYILATTATATATNPNGSTVVVPYNLTVDCGPG
ncbi:MAG: hypothetical protein FWH48_11740 [Oscillospiraceae bacterium]|nr:hypothetical protein [Oscillospiraceae bacterium]